jgi:TRAP-type mannitol/chloroaromatic compound transport system permease small subunit
MSSALPIIDFILLTLIVLPVLTLVGAAVMPDTIQVSGPWLTRIRDTIDAVLSILGKSTAWLSLIMVLVMFLIVLMRYVFGLGFIWMQESVTYMHGLLFMLAAAYTLLIDGHVRVDIFYRDASEKVEALTNLFGAYFFLFPVMFLIVDTGIPYIEGSWSIKEGSKETSGIQAIYLLKAAILVFAWTMILQGISLVNSVVLFLIGEAPHASPPSAPGPDEAPAI